MYYPSYFSGGYAIHGSPSVPAGPVSHGCVRIPMSAAIGFFQRNPVGTPVTVVP
jgi:lipoprotein-anchoring transpeptidase ErfK/SrfK